MGSILAHIPAECWETGHVRVLLADVPDARTGPDDEVIAAALSFFPPGSSIVDWSVRLVRLDVVMGVMVKVLPPPSSTGLLLGRRELPAPPARPTFHVNAPRTLSPLLREK
jgi:hypothetical protein